MASSLHALADPSAPAWSRYADVLVMDEGLTDLNMLKALELYQFEEIATAIGACVSSSHRRVRVLIGC